MKCGVVVRSAFSGIGAGEMALHMMEAAVQNVSPESEPDTSFGVHIASQFDNDDAALQVLAREKAGPRPTMSSEMCWSLCQGPSAESWWNWSKSLR